MAQEAAEHPADQVPVDVRVASDADNAAIEGTPVEHAGGSAGRAHAEPVSVQQSVVAEPVQYVAYDASATTDSHHDQGSGATGHVEDATPDTHAAGAPADEPPAEEPPPPAHEDPPPEPAPAPTPEPEHHDDTTAAAPEGDHTP